MLLNGFSTAEIIALQKDPRALIALADYHEVRITEADSIGPPISDCIAFHEKRKHELLTEAARIEAEY